MADRISKQQRSYVMSRIGSKDTLPEIIVRKALHHAGFRFRICRQDLPGSPDIVLPKYNTVIFVHGCFWHQHKKCKIASTPKTNTSFWQEKFRRNVTRDKRNVAELKKLGWHVIIIWECQVHTKLSQLIIALKENN